MNAVINKHQSEHTEMHSFFARMETVRSFPKTSNNSSPITHTLFQSFFNIVEKISPRYAQRWGVKLFFTPRQRKLKQHDLQVLKNSRISTIDFAGEQLPVCSWGNDDDPAIIFTHGWGGRPTDFSYWIEPLIKEGFKVVSAEGPAHGNSKSAETSLPELTSFFMELVKTQPNIAGYIGHSLGGAVTLLGFENGVRPKPSIFINTPADPDGIIDVFLQKLGGGPDIGNHIKKVVMQKFGKKFEEFSAISTAKKLPEVPVLLIHDRYDSESPIYHFEAFKEVIPWSEHMITDNLGHNRILIDAEVVREGTSFMSRNKKSL